MPVEIKWISHASFRIAGAGCARPPRRVFSQKLRRGTSVLYVDPWKIEDEPHDADVVFVSHSHHDHCSPPDIEKVSKDDTAIVAPTETIEKLHAEAPTPDSLGFGDLSANAVDPGERICIKEIAIEGVAAYNIQKAFHPRGNHWCGAVFTIDGERIYYAGDTDLIPEMSDLQDVDVALLPVGGTYTLDADEAVRACKAVGCKAAIPFHWGDIIGSLEDAQRFADGADCEVHLLQPGEIITI